MEVTRNGNTNASVTFRYADLSCKIFLLHTRVLPSSANVRYDILSVPTVRWKIIDVISQHWQYRKISTREIRSLCECTGEHICDAVSVVHRDNNLRITCSETIPSRNTSIHNLNGVEGCHTFNVSQYRITRARHNSGRVRFRVSLMEKSCHSRMAVIVYDTRECVKGEHT